MIKLIASDLDGTLLQNEAQELTPPGNRTYPGADPKRSSFCCRKRTPVCKRTTSLSRDQRRYLLHRRKRFSVHSSGESYLPGTD